MPFDVESLRNTLEQGNPAQRLEALKLVLRNREDQHVLPILIDRIERESNPEVLSNLIKVFACTGSDKAFPYLIRFLVHDDDRVRANAVEALEMTGNDSTPIYLLATLNDKNQRVRLNSLKALQKYDMVDPLPLLDRILSSENNNERVGAAWVVAHLDNPQATKRLLEAYRSERAPQVRLRMISSLETDPTPEILKAFGEALLTADEVEKSALQRALGRSYLYAHRMQREVVDGIFTALRGLGESLFREAATNALDEKKTKETIEDDLRSFNPAIRRGALVQMASLFPNEAQTVLENFLADPDLDVARTADILLKGSTTIVEPPPAPVREPEPIPEIAPAAKQPPVEAPVQEPVIAPAAEQPSVEAPLQEPEAEPVQQEAPKKEETDLLTTSVSGTEQISVSQSQGVDLTALKEVVDKSEENLEFLQQISGTDADRFNFKSLSEEQLNTLTRGFSTKVFPEGKFIYRDNEQVRFWYLIKRGSVELLSPDNKSLSILGPGDTLGEMPEEGQNIIYQNKARAMEEVEVLIMGQEKLAGVQAELPEIHGRMRDISTTRRALLAQKILAGTAAGPEVEERDQAVEPKKVLEESSPETPEIGPELAEPEPDTGPADISDFPCFGEHIPDDETCLTCEVGIQCCEATTEPVEIDVESLETFACLGQYEEGVESCKICTAKVTCKNKAMDLSNDEYPCFGEFDDGDPGCLTCLVIDQCKQKKG